MAKKTTMALLAAGLAAVFLSGAGRAVAETPASVHGHVTNPAGMPQAGTVQLSHDLTGELKDRKWAYTFTVDANGNYKGTGIAPGEYFARMAQGDKSLDFNESVKFAPGEDKTLDFDMSRQAYIDKMTPEEKAALAEYKKKAGATISENKVIANLNATLKTVRADLEAAKPTHADVSKDVSDMQSAVQAKPDESVLWMSYGDALTAQGDHLAKADRDANKPSTTDEDVLKQYSDSVDAYKKSADLDAASKKPVPLNQASAYNDMGNALAKSGKIEDASAAFENAVKLMPANAGMYYGNEAAVLYNANQSDAALAAANKAIAADPNRADPYFIKGQALLPKSTIDPKTQKLTAPPGCVEAYEKYLQLAPDGPQAQMCREVLASLGEKVDTRYNAGRK